MTERFKIVCLLLAALTLAFDAAPAHAQRGTYGAAKKQQIHKAGEFDYYALVLSWSPTHCASPQGRRDRTQCAPRNNRGYSFILHGLWPQYWKGYPERCRTRLRPFVSNRTISSMMDIMPSKGLIIHEYRKHGTCSGMVPQDYYSFSRTLFDKIKIPAAYVSPDKEQFISPDGLINQFVRANPGMNANMMSVVCRGSGNRLREVRICFSKDGKLQKCGQNENQRKLCSAKRMFVPPIRYTQR